MKADPSFTDILTAASRVWAAKEDDCGLFSLALPLGLKDPLEQLSIISEDQDFRFIWDCSPGISIAAAGQCQKFNLSGPRRFELAQKFTNTTLRKVNDVSIDAPPHARPRILLAFPFFDQASERKRSVGNLPVTQALLPRWQITYYRNNAWLRLNGIATNEADIRELTEQLWLMRQLLINNQYSELISTSDKISGFSNPQQWQTNYRELLLKGIDLVNSRTLDKLVLAVKKSIVLESPLDPILIINRLRSHQKTSCRFLWQDNANEFFFGASPEKLLTLHRGTISSDALAGTAKFDENCENLLKSDKDLREHHLVVESIFDKLISLGLQPTKAKKPKLVRHGQLVHLYTPIKAKTNGQLPLYLADALHPTPAVAGLPTREALNWLRALESFERGNYAAPIGWIDSAGDTELRVAIRCAKVRDNNLDLTAGAGIVRGSIIDRELEEVALKFDVLASQFDLNKKFQNQSC